MKYKICSCHLVGLLKQILRQVSAKGPKHLASAEVRHHILVLPTTAYIVEKLFSYKSCNLFITPTVWCWCVTFHSHRFLLLYCAGLLSSILRFSSGEVGAFPLAEARYSRTVYTWQWFHDWALHAVSRFWWTLWFEPAEVRHFICIIT